MKDLYSAFGQFFLGVLLFTFLLFYGAFTWGFVTFKFYGWFIPQSFSAPEITYYQAVGLSVLLSLFKDNNIRGVKEEYAESKTGHVITSILTPWVILLSGYVIHSVI